VLGYRLEVGLASLANLTLVTPVSENPNLMAILANLSHLLVAWNLLMVVDSGLRLMVWQSVLLADVVVPYYPRVVDGLRQWELGKVLEVLVILSPGQ